jgi:predicted RNase H-like HicB family nuclease
MLKNKYTIHIAWSEEDNCYIASVDGYKSVKTHGDTFVEAAEQMQSALETIEEE